MAVPPDTGLDAPANRILLVLGQTPFPVELLDGQGLVLYHNVAYARTFRPGLPAVQHLLDLPTRVFPETFPEGQTRQQIFDRAQAEGLWKGEVRIADVEGRNLPFRLSVFPIHQPGAERFEYAVFYEDISEEVHAREDLAHQQNLVAIRYRQAQMGELLSMIAHQWRQPLTVVMSLVGNIQLKANLGGVDPEYLQSKLDRMAQTIHFLSETIDSFRNFYAPSKFKTEEDLAALLHKALGLVAPNLQKMGAHVEISVPPEPVVARVFGGEFLQVALELINNARDALAAGSQGSPVLKLSILREPGRVILNVEDNGGGISDAALPHIFDPYFTTKEGASGTGLGLYMSKLIVENHHGGTLSALSAAGWTAFSCSFPVDGNP